MNKLEREWSRDKVEKGLGAFIMGFQCSIAFEIFIVGAQADNGRRKLEFTPAHPWKGRDAFRPN